MFLNMTIVAMLSKYCYESQMNKEIAQTLHSTDESLPIALLRAREVLMGPVREMLSNTGLTEQQWRILRVLDEKGAIDAKRLAEKSALLAPSLSRILVGMEKRELIARRGDTEDRRRQVIEISKSGKALISDNIDEAQRLARDIQERLGPERLELLLELLRDINRWPSVE